MNEPHVLSAAEVIAMAGLAILILAGLWALLWDRRIWRSIFPDLEGKYDAERDRDEDCVLSPAATVRVEWLPFREEVRGRDEDSRKPGGVE